MKKSWVVTLEGERHIVELDLDIWIGGRKIYVDTELALKHRSGPFAVNEEYRFQVGGKPALLSIGGVIIPRIELFIDGKRV